MAYCEVCGTELDEYGICPKCAAEAEETSASDAVAKVVDKFNSASDQTGDYDAEDIEQNRIFAVLGYLGIFLLVPIICAPNSKFARFHVSEAIDLLIYNVVYVIVAGILTWLCWRVGTALGVIVLGIFLLGTIVSFIFWIIGIANAARGLAKDIPMIGTWKLLK